MDSEFPSNSHKAKTAGSAPEEEKKVSKVVEGKVIKRQKPLGKKFTELFISGDANSAKQYVILEVIVPAVRDMVADSISQGVERVIFGEARSSSRRTGARPASMGTTGYTNYSRYSKDPREIARPAMTPKARARHDFSEIILATRVEADEVIERMYDLYNRYELVTVADLYNLVGEPPEYTDDKWGWTEMNGIEVRRVRSGYLLELPRPTSLD